MAAVDWLLRGTDRNGPADKRYKTYSRSNNAARRHDRLIELLRGTCRRLAKCGWRDLLGQHDLDIEAWDLAQELAKPLSVDRSVPGFEDFALEGIRGIEPSKPALSLLFHAFASPAVVTYRANGSDHPLKDFPTPAEIELAENYVYGVQPPSVEDLFVRTGGTHLAVVVFAAEYRTGINTVHRKYADMCYSRCGIARVGTTDARYMPAARGYLPFVDEDPSQLRVLPCRYSPYIAALIPGSKEGHGPMRFIDPDPKAVAASSRTDRDAGAPPPPPALQSRAVSDAVRSFWIPVHKLFDGFECIREREITVRLSANHVNEKLRRAHLFFGANGHNSGWSEPEISNPPFIFSDEIAEFSQHDEDGNWLLKPIPHNPLIEPAQYGGKPLTYRVPESREGAAWTTYQSSLNLKLKPSGARAAPEYLHARHKIDEAGRELDLNQFPGVTDVVKSGNYNARHYRDYTGDGWIDVECSEIALEIPRRLPAYSIVSTPDFFPIVNQSDLTKWTDQSVPPVLLNILWPQNPGRPEALSDQRYAANLELAGAGFDARDDTMTAIVGGFGSGAGSVSRLARSTPARATTLPDSAAGVFAPGWDVSYDRTQELDQSDTGTALAPGITFLNTYGLGSPFAEDSKLCAALSSFWPAVAPDITRTFAPSSKYATSTPLADDIIGLGGKAGWDGVQGPIIHNSKKVIEYPLLAYGDYVEVALRNGFNIKAISKTTKEEYAARTLAMARVYSALGAVSTPDKAKWAVLSFRLADHSDSDLQTALAATGRTVQWQFTYRFKMFQHEGRTLPHPTRFDKVLVPYDRLILLFADPSIVLHQLQDGAWRVHELRR